MKLKLLDGWKPVLIAYSDWLVSRGGLTVGPICLFKKKYKDNTSTSTIGLEEHEFTHVRQFYRWWGINGILYLFAKWRLKFEVEAYKVQLKYVPWDIDIFANYITTRYKLNISEADAKKLLEAA